MNRVAIGGAGITDCRSRWVEATYWELFQQATRRTLEDAKCTAAEIDSVVYGIYNDIFEHQAIPESALTGIIGRSGKPGTRVPGGGATDFYAPLCMGDDDKYPGDIGDVTVRARIIEMLCRQGNKNPFGQRRDETVTVEQVMASRWIIAPFLRLLEACMYTEGAAGVLFASEKKAREISERTGVPPIWVKGIGAANESYQAGRGGAYKPLWSIVSDRLAAERAYAMAGVKPSDIQLVELHDAFIAQFMITMGEMGFVPLGRTRRLVDDGVMADIRELGDAKRPQKGQVLINPSGGLIFGGHFVGGSNMFSMWSARREMLRRQMPLALIHGTGAINAVFGGAIVVELQDGGAR